MDDSVLRSYLDRIRDIARLKDDEALAETAQLVGELSQVGEAVPFEVQQFEMELARAREELGVLRREVSVAQEALAREVPVDVWTHGDLRRRADDLGRYWSPTIRERLAGDINELKHLGASTAEQVDLQRWIRITEECASENFSSAQTAARALRDLRQAEEFFASRKLTGEWGVKIRQAKERSARYRANKKLAEAEVAEAGGNLKKTQKLRDEAAVLLKQDWVDAFPGEPFPTQ